MQILSGSNRAIRLGLFVLLVALCISTHAMAQEVNYGGQMTLEWTNDTYSCPPGTQGYCPGQQLVETSASGTEIIPLSADYSSCSISILGSGPTIAPVGIGVGPYPSLDIVFVVPSSTYSGTCGYLFYPGSGAFSYYGDITTPGGSFSTYLNLGGGFAPPQGQLNILSWNSTDTYPTALTFEATGSSTVCDGPDFLCLEGYGYAENSWSFSGELTACSETYNGTFNGNLEIARGLTCIINGTVTGNVTQTGGGLFISNATIGGNLQIVGAGSFSIASTTVNGNVQIQNIPAGSAQNEICETEVKGNLQLNNNGTAAAIGTTSPSCPGNTIRGNLQVNNNTAAVQVFDDAVGGNLQCQSNSSITGSGDTARLLQGQCAAF